MARERRFEESELLFRFDRNWAVRKYDAHRYYDSLKSAGLKGVDFLAIRGGAELILLEVKNYRTRRRDRPFEPEVGRLREPALFVDDLVRKVEDTVLGIQTIGQYLERKWAYRLLTPLLDLLSNGALDWGNWPFWRRVVRLLEAGRWRAVIWLELDASYPDIPSERIPEVRKYLQSHLAERLQLHGVEVTLASLEDTKQWPGLEVCWFPDGQDP